MKILLKKIIYITAGILLASFGTVYAINITVPSAPTSGYTLTSLSTGAYTPTALSKIFPFTPTTNFGATANATATPIWFQAGLQASSTSQIAYASTTAISTTATSTFSGYLALKSGPHINALAYGAIGNNSTDNATALQNAFNACTALLPVYIPAGTYKTTVALTIPRDCRVFGDNNFAYFPQGFPGGSDTQPATLIAADNSSGNFTAANTYVISMASTTGMSRIAVKGTNVLGEANAIQLAGSWIELDDVMAYSANTGVYCLTGGGNVYQGNQIRDSYIGYNKDTGVYLGAGCADSNIFDSYIFANALYNIRVYTTKTLISGNTIETGGQVGIDLFGAKRLQIVGNHIVDNGREGIDFNGFGSANQHISVVGNSFSDNGQDQTSGHDCHIRFVAGVFDLAMSGNTFATSTGGGGGAVVPNYDYCGVTSPVLNSAMIRDLPLAQAIGIYADATTQNAILPSLTVQPAYGGMGTTTWQTNSIPYYNGTNFTESNGALNFDGTRLNMTYASSTAITTSGQASLGSLAGASVSSLTASYLPKWNSGVFANSLIYDTGTNIGIGTTTPASILHLFQNGTTTLTLTNSGSKSNHVERGANIDFFTGTLGPELQFPLARISALNTYDGTGGYRADLAFLTEASNAAPTERMRIVGLTGNVGIGTTSPGSLLSLGSLANFTTATSTFYSTGGINLAAGCFAKNGACITGIPGGSDTQVQFNDGGSFGGEAALTYTKGNSPQLTVGTSTIGTIFTDSVGGGFVEFFGRNRAGTAYVDIYASTGDTILDIKDTVGQVFLSPNHDSFIRTTGTFGLRTGAGTKDAIFNTLPISSTDKTFTFPNWTGTFAVATATLQVSSINATTSSDISTFAGAITSTATGANTFPYASTTALTVSGNAYFPGSSIWNSSGNVGIGTTTPWSILNIETNMSNAYASNLSGSSRFTLSNTNSTANNESQIDFFGTDTAGLGQPNARIYGIYTSHTISAQSGEFAFVTRNAGTLGERVRITAAGNVGIGTTTPQWMLTAANSTKPQLALTDTTASSFAWTMRSINNSLFIATSTYTATSSASALWIDPNARVYLGTIPSCNGATNALGTTNNQIQCDSGVSDARLKKDINPLTGGLDTILKLKPITFYWNDTTGNASQHGATSPLQQYGFTAQSVQPLLPSAVDHSPDGYLTLDKTALIAPLVAAVQEQQEKINALGGGVQKAVRSVEENWQWLCMGLLALGLLYQQFQIRKLKK